MLNHDKGNMNKINQLPGPLPMPLHTKVMDALDLFTLFSRLILKQTSNEESVMLLEFNMVASNKTEKPFSLKMTRKLDKTDNNYISLPCKSLTYL